jgi:hypothetical protein
VHDDMGTKKAQRLIGPDNRLMHLRGYLVEA